MAFSGGHEQLNMKFYHQNNKLGFMIIYINDLTESSECIKYAISHFVKVNQANGNMDIY
ncbi:hypothetical protein DSM106972_060800 [Dulcicalothrix desertica PCC 7102]|uniref:Uncharacterized protein n=1 Tax=Dulcicalothrix desertica PCC 7102 TaxID=232991 RepID=A0A433V906_9CYAN|nr:hypothetical protein [Dulcicalothrix desertica]RUT02602.1 hypothetical protein DSM106972_060800 [Dulcicalothrix desertica PCC 7102]TWH55185.1 hypothetical protein CAL7102_03301 [Dulcicalothrix desertica PCC 7102]